MDKSTQVELLKSLSTRLINLEFAMENNDYLSEKDLKKVQENYRGDAQILVRLIVATGVEMGYSMEIQDWMDTKPLEKLNRQSGMTLAETGYYQKVLTDMLMGAITTT